MKLNERAKPFTVRTGDRAESNRFWITICQNLIRHLLKEAENSVVCGKGLHILETSPISNIKGGEDLRMTFCNVRYLRRENDTSK